LSRLYVKRYIEKLARGNKRNNIIFVINGIKPVSEENIMLNTLVTKNRGTGRFDVNPHP
jgi:hypothetical protein